MLLGSERLEVEGRTTRTTFFAMGGITRGCAALIGDLFELFVRNLDLEVGVGRRAALVPRVKFVSGFFLAADACRSYI